MTPQPFTIIPGRYYAWQMLPGYLNTPYYSPVFVHSITPLKQGDGTFDLHIENCGYAEGVKTMGYRLKTLRRTTNYLVAMAHPEEDGRTIIISEFTEAWAREHFTMADLDYLGVSFASRHESLDASCIVENELFLGAFPHAHDVPTLKNLGIQAVLSIVDDHDPVAVSPEIQQAFAWAQVPIRDSYLKGVPTITDLADAVAVLREWRAAGIGTVYIHCMLGLGRSPLVTMAYLVHGKDGAEKMRLTKAIALVATRRPKADPNVAQHRVLSEYVERALHEPQLEPRYYRPSPRVIRGKTSSRPHA